MLCKTVSLWTEVFCHGVRDSVALHEEARGEVRGDENRASAQRGRIQMRSRLQKSYRPQRGAESRVEDEATPGPRCTPISYEDKMKQNGKSPRSTAQRCLYHLCPPPELWRRTLHSRPTASNRGCGEKWVGSQEDVLETRESRRAQGEGGGYLSWVMKPV